MCDIKTTRELERKWCEILKADLNTALPILTPNEKETYMADYYKSNKEAISKRKADYYETNKEAILKRQADYREANKEAISKRKADYREANKQSKRYYCDICEIVCESNKDLQRHLKTSKHFWKYIYSVD